MASQDLFVTVTIVDVENCDVIPQRTLILKAPDWYVKIGRGTQSGDEELRPAEDNAWFDSRVMSRNHAILRAHPTTRELSIEDVGSMHGTHSDGMRLRPLKPLYLNGHDSLVLGADVTRGSTYFSAVELMISFRWSDEPFPDSPPGPASTSEFRREGDMTGAERPALSTNFRNSFRVDYSEEEGEELDDDSDVDIIGESVRDPSLEIVSSPLTFVAPESDGSDRDSFSSEDAPYDHESPTTSPFGISDAGKQADHGPSTTAAELSPAISVLEIPSLPLHLGGRPPQVSEHTEQNPICVDDDDVESDYQRDPIDGESTTEQSNGCSLVSPGSNPPDDSTTSPPGVMEPVTYSGLAYNHPPRAPSPSDAAMVKPCNDRGLASPVTPQPWCSGEVDLMTYDSGRPGPVWATYNSVSGEQVPSTFSIAPSYHSVETNESILPPAPVIRDPGQPSVEPGVDIPTIPSVTLHETAEDIHMPPAPHAPPYAAKVSIDDILDKSTQHADSSASKESNLKRKVDQISDGLTSEPYTGLLFSSSTVDPLDGSDGSKVSPADAHLPDAPQLIISPSSSISDPIPVIELDQPPRKKVKKNKKKQAKVENRSGGSIVKYAAAALAGIAVGAAGTIFGLAALPTDYFA